MAKKVLKNIRINSEITKINSKEEKDTTKPIDKLMKNTNKHSRITKLRKPRSYRTICW
jgi:hypothetical protein